MKRMVFALLATAALLLTAVPFVGAAGGGHDDADGVTIMVMKHACDPEQVRNLDEFNAIIEAAESPVAALAGTVLACPTVVNPGDETTDGVKSDAAEFSFSVEDANGTQQLPANTTAAKLCESDLQLDANGDGKVAEPDVCLDISHYVFEGVANGPITVTETQPPAGSRFGELLFTPTEIDDNNDADSLVSLDRQAGVIELDTTADEDGAVMLHVYNFETEMPDSAMATEAGAASPINLGLLFSLVGAAAFGLWLTVGLRRREPSSR